MPSFLLRTGARVKIFFRNRFSKFREINRKYAHPSVPVKGWRAVALYGLLVYLATLLAILLFKFVSLVHP